MEDATLPFNADSLALLRAHAEDGLGQVLGRLNVAGCLCLAGHLTSSVIFVEAFTWAIQTCWRSRAMKQGLVLDKVVLLGRTLDEYQRFFALNLESLRGRAILDVASGVSSFCAEGNRIGL